MSRSNICIDITNNRYGRLTVIKRVQNYQYKNGKQCSQWQCRCDCGNLIIVPKTGLGRTTKSCGCLRQETARKNKKRNPHSSIKSLYRLLTNSAKKRNLLPFLDFNIFKKLIKRRCYYCNNKPSNIYKTHKHSIPVKYNGIDRINSSLGYHYKNVVSCCWRCNCAKNNMSKQEFLNWTVRLFNNLKYKGKI